MTTTRTLADSFPRKQEYSGTTYNGRAVIGFKGYEVVEDGSGGWVLICTAGGHDSPHSIVEQPA